MSRWLIIDRPYALSVLIGGLLGIGLFFVLAPHLRPHVSSLARPSLDRSASGVTPASSPAQVTGRQTPVRVVRRPAVPVAVAKSTPRRRVVTVNPALILQRAQERKAFHKTRIRRRSEKDPSAPRKADRPLQTSEVARGPRAPRAKLSPPRPARDGTSVLRAPRVVKPAPAPTVLLPAASAPPEGGAHYLVQVGPVHTQERAAEIVRHLVQAGFDSRVAINETTGSSSYHVVSETVPFSVAERRVAVLTQLGFRPELQSLAGGFAQLRFGAFASQQDAERLAERVRVTGHAFAAVMQEGRTAYLITLGPYRQEAVDSIQALLRLRFRWMLPVNVRSVN